MNSSIKSFAFLGALLLASCDDSTSTAASSKEPETCGSPLQNALPDLKLFTVAWSRSYPMSSDQIQLDSLGVLTASRTLPDEAATRETRRLVLDSTFVLAIRDSLLLPSILSAPPRVERDPICADGMATSYDLVITGGDPIRLFDQGCHPGTASPEGYQLADRIARSLFKEAFPTE